MQYPLYENRQNVELEWAESYPAHWSKKRFKFLLKNGYEGLKIGPFGSQIKSEDLTNEGYKIYGQENVINNNFKLGNRYLDEDKFQELTVYEIFPGDLLTTMMGTSGKCEIAPSKIEQGIMDSHLIRLRTNDELFVEFSRYLIDQSNYVEYQMRQLGKGSIMHGLNSTVIKNLDFLLPPIEEQHSIVKFLDYKTQQIDQLIEKKKALIEKLNEQRIAVITQAVTKGLDKNAKMKPSGVDWLGEVPEHWKTRRLKFLTNESLQYGANEAAVLDDRDLPRFIRITDVKDDGTLHDDTFRSLPEEVAEPFLLDEGDILLARSGATVGKTFKYSKSWGKSAYAGYLIKFSADREIMTEDFAYMYFQSSVYWANINSTLIQATIQNFSAEKYANIKLPLPGLDEQKEIVDYLSKNLNRLDKMKSLAQGVIERLEEFWSSLITDAVTGKIDVRNIEIGEVV